jgi:hypothetical protein
MRISFFTVFFAAFFAISTPSFWDLPAARQANAPSVILAEEVARLDVRS